MDNESRQRADEIVAQIKELVKKGNIARILVKRGEDTVLNIPLNVGIVGTVLGLTAAPWALIATAVATLGFDCRIELVKTDGETMELFSREVGQKAVDLGSAVVDEVKTMAHRWGVTFVLLSQVSRESGRDMTRGGTGGHGMGGAVLEQTADYELELYRDVGPEHPRTICTLRKNRNGPAGRSFELFLTAPSMEFSRRAEAVEFLRPRRPLFGCTTSIVV